MKNCCFLQAVRQELAWLRLAHAVLMGCQEGCRAKCAESVGLWGCFSPSFLRVSRRGGPGQQAGRMQVLCFSSGPRRFQLPVYITAAVWAQHHSPAVSAQLMAGFVSAELKGTLGTWSLSCPLCVWPVPIGVAVPLWCCLFNVGLG